MAEKFYMTAAIDYNNDIPHIGTASEKIQADAVVRYKRLKGYDAFLVMGTDEHSTNAARKAKKMNLSPEEYSDQMVEKFKDVWRKLNINYDDFVRTSEKRHFHSVQRFFQKIYDNGDIYKGTYKGWYCVSCEAFIREKDLVEGKCPYHNRKPDWIEEENYFFTLSRYQDRLLEHIEKHPEFIQPEVRRNEILNIIKGGLEDVSFSRSSTSWGIPVPFDTSHVIYVWFDALLSYITGIGYAGDDDKFTHYWPADIHLIGKDITRFHCIIWPTMLMSAGLELPKTIFGHGFIYFEGERLSKTLGNIVDPLDTANRFGADPFRYFILREITFGKDGDFSWKKFIDRYNADLANDLGNLLNRTLVLIERSFGGEIPRSGEEEAVDEDLRNTALETVERVDKAMEELNLSGALEEIWTLVRRANRYVEETQPWSLAKNKEERLATVLYNLAEALRFTSILLSPFIPETVSKMLAQLGIEEKIRKGDWSKLERWGGFPPGTKVKRAGPLFPRLRKEDEALAERGRKEEAVAKSDNRISYEDFEKVELRVAEVVSAEKVAGADKLLKLEIDLGQERRTIVAGIAKQYSPSQIIGKKIIIVANLKPATIRGIESNGMLLAAVKGNDLALLILDRDIELGSRVQ